MGCSGGRQTPAAAYRHVGDRLKASAGGIFGLPCTRQSGSDPVIFEHSPDRDCYRFDPPVRMSGIWLNDFEGSEFLPDGSTYSDRWTFSSRIWLEEDSWGSALPKDRDENYGKAYAVTFIGNLSSYQGSYGHMGGSARLLLVDRLISIREVPRPRNGEIVKIAAPIRTSR
jgi:hypothetical protein